MSATEVGPEEIARIVMEVFPRLMRLIGATVAKPEEGLGLRSITQMRVLKHLAERPWLVSELAQVMMLSVPTVSVAVDGLVRRGLVVRGEASDDRRANPLSLTPEGVRCYQAAWDHTSAVLGQILGQIPAPHRAALVQGLAAVARALDAASSDTTACIPMNSHSKELIP